MNTFSRLYWPVTVLFSLMMLSSATMYFISEDMVRAFSHLGFPNYFRLQLGIAKYLGVVALLVPFIPRNVKEWAYAGFGISIISAGVAHASVGDPVTALIPPAIAFLLLATSYLSQPSLINDVVASHKKN